jgi:hypothetical protein
MGTGGGLFVIDFSEQGNSAHFRRDGWSGQEPDRVWGIGPRSVLLVPIQSSGRPIVLEAELAPAEPSPAITGQLVRIGVNGTAVGAVRIGSRTMIRHEIDPALLRGGMLEIEFGFPGFSRAGSFGISKDDRALSCWFSFVRIYTKDMYKPGPWFPPSHPDIPVAGLSPPLPAEQPDAAAGAEQMIYTFGRSGTVSPFLRDGWHAGEDDYTWTDGTVSRLELPAPQTPGAYVLRLDAAPPVTHDNGSSDDVTILLDGIVIGQFSFREPSAWAVPLPRELYNGHEILPLTLIFPHAVRPGDLGPSKDERLLGIAVIRIGVLPLPPRFTSVECLRADQAGMAQPIVVSREFLTGDTATVSAAIRARLGMDAVTLMREFESLGTDSEFGIVQRKLGLEVLNLFRFCETTLPDLTRALCDDLKAMDDPATVELNDARPGECWLTLPRYNFRWRLMSREACADRDSLRRENALALGYSRRKFREGLHAGRKIYVLKQGRPIPLAQAAVVLMELNRIGNATLLCVEAASNGRRPGEVELLMPGLMRGYVAGIATDNDVGSAEPVDWLRMLANATLLKRGSNDGVFS